MKQITILITFAIIGFILGGIIKAQVGVSATVPENDYHRCLEECKVNCYNEIIKQ